MTTNTLTTTLPDSELQIITYHSVSTDISNSEFTSPYGTSRTRTFQAADSIAFIQAAERGGTLYFNQPNMIFFEDTHFDENTTLEYLDNTKDFAFNLRHPEEIDSCAVGCEDNLRSDQVQQRENRKVA
ncbi:hypothetical protein BLNAU_22041 [Blattamonas nauphoetae]|uniref:Uncharacterized protein n=1 Tax=Blattamonas nauphoetae TaxID=2049346 RepID=A0ABQ9WKJ0_9EUKA|nr:hypothetical protein BLNAU_25110 [Blattamonas nauphoetae]KAK2943030.1 hypothetical protein BLNAU_22041 [Blattamonas nauphoetae]